MKLLIQSKTSIVQLLKFGNGYVISSPLYRVCNDLSMQRLKLIHGSKSGPGDQKRTVTDIMHMIHFVKKHQTNKRNIRIKWYEKDKKNERHLIYSVSLKRASSFRNNSDIWISDYWVKDQPNIMPHTLCPLEDPSWYQCHIVTIHTRLWLVILLFATQYSLYKIKNVDFDG